MKSVAKVTVLVEVPDGNEPTAQTQGTPYLPPPPPVEEIPPWRAPAEVPEGAQMDNASHIIAESDYVYEREPLSKRITYTVNKLKKAPWWRRYFKGPLNREQAAILFDGAMARRAAGETPTLTWDDAKAIAEAMGIPMEKVVRDITGVAPAQASKDEAAAAVVPPKGERAPPAVGGSKTSNSDPYTAPEHPESKLPFPPKNGPAQSPPKPKKTFRNVFNYRGAPDSHDLAEQLGIEWNPHGGPPVPALQEMWLDFKRHFTARGRRLAKLKKRLQEQVIEARLDLDRLITYYDERSQGIRLRAFLAEEHTMIDNEILDEFKAVFPHDTDEQRAVRLGKFKRDWRRRFLYKAATDPALRQQVLHEQATAQKVKA
jgi:hypothetical protein